jgi:hypothetical protein
MPAAGKLAGFVILIDDFSVGSVYIGGSKISGKTDQGW